MKTRKRKSCSSSDNSEFALEFNNPETSDRILRFEIIDDHELQLTEKLSNEQPTLSNEPTHQLPAAPVVVENTTELEVDVGQAPNSQTKRYCLRKSSQGCAQPNSGEKFDVAKISNSNPCHSNERSNSVNGEASMPSRESRSAENMLYVHSIVLAVKSPYFKAMFYSGMKESSSKEVVMKVHASEMKAHLILIEAMYKPYVLDKKHAYFLAQVLSLADKYNVPQITKKCQSVLLSLSLTLKTWEHILFHILQHASNVNKSHNHFKKLLIEEFKPLEKTWTTQTFRALTENSLKLLLDNTELAVACENTVFIALMDWVKTNINAETLSCSYLLSVVRFECLSVDFLHDVVQFHDIATKMAGFEQLYKNGLAYFAFSKSRREHIDVELNLRKRIMWKKQGTSISWTWLIDAVKRNDLLRDEFLISKAFYCLGYRMQLKMWLPDDSRESRISYHIGLRVLDMRPGSMLHLSWRISSLLLMEGKKPFSPDCKKLYSSDSNFGKLESLILETKLQLVPSDRCAKIDLFVKFLP